MIEIDAERLASDHRFSRFELISWWDQQRLRRARVLVIGAGALGNEIVKNCSLVGIGNILVADMDRIENSNLSRSVLFRKDDNGKLKAEVACAAARRIYPDVNARHFAGNIVHQLGLGAYLWADVIIGGLDNREARVAINSGAAFAGKAWIDGAIEVLDGVARVFSPADGPCYECTMSDIDWKILESRRSCALLTREEMEEGKVPTTPTMASIVGALQVQEAVKMIHGMEVIKGQGLVFSGHSPEPYLLNYTRKPECYGHEKCTRLQPLDRSVSSTTVGEILHQARTDLGPGAVVELSRDIIAELHCPQCSTSEPLYRPLGAVTEKEAACPKCEQTRAAETCSTLGITSVPADMTLEQIGVPPFDVLTARSGDDRFSYLMAGDSRAVLGDLADDWDPLSAAVGE